MQTQTQRKAKAKAEEEKTWRKAKGGTANSELRAASSQMPEASSQQPDIPKLCARAFTYFYAIKNQDVKRMNTDKAKRLLKKAQALFDNLSDQGTMSALERDLLLSYLRDLYEEIGRPQVNVTSTNETMHEPVRMTIEKPVSDFPTPPKITMQTPTWQEPPKQIIPEPIHTHVEQIVTPVKQEFAEPLAEIKITKTAVSEVLSSAAKTEMMAKDPLLNALFEFKEIGELAEKLKLQPIDKIEHGMGINERILTVNELFSGDNELFRKTLEHLNSLQNFNEAQGYLIEGVASQFDWADETKKNKASYFIQLVRRRYARNN